MPLPIMKSEFLRRLSDAVDFHRENIARVASNKKPGEAQAIVSWDSASMAAEMFKLPAVAQPLNPMVCAICEISKNEMNCLEVMALAEAAWEYMHDDMEAYTLFVKLNS